MARTRKPTRWLKETSDQSGFDNFSFDGVTFHKKWTSIKQNSLNIAPEEFDVPPPSSKPLGGADVSGNPRSDSLTTTIPPGFDIITQYITAGGGIAATRASVVYVSGSNQAVNITANPQISAGYAQQIMSVMCVDSGVTLDDGTGLDLVNDASFVMTSGSVINLIYSRTDNLWYETSRVEQGGI